MVSYQYCPYLYYHDIHLHRYICCYCPLTYDNYVIFIIFSFSLSRNFAFITNFEYVHLWYFNKYFSQQRKKSITFDFQSSPTSEETKFLLPKLSNNWNTDHYRGLDDRDEGYLESDLNCLVVGNLWQYTTVTSQCELFPLNWTRRMMYFDRWSQFEKCPSSV